MCMIHNSQIQDTAIEYTYPTVQYVCGSGPDESTYISTTCRHEGLSLSHLFHASCCYHLILFEWYYVSTIINGNPTCYRCIFEYAYKHTNSNINNIYTLQHSKIIFHALYRLCKSISIIISAIIIYQKYNDFTKFEVHSWFL